MIGCVSIAISKGKTAGRGAGRYDKTETALKSVANKAPTVGSQGLREKSC